MDFHQQDIRRFLLESIPSRFSHITAWDFESLVRYLLEVDGYELQPAVPTGDLANKILASKEDALLVVQPLRLDQDVLVEEAEIRKAIHSRSFYKADQSWIITTSSFTPEAKQFAEETEIELWDWDALYEALCQSFFEGKSHTEFLQEHPLAIDTEEKVSSLKLKVKWQATEGIGPEWFNLGITISNPTDRNIYIHLELPALIDNKRNQVMADQWIDGDFVAGMIYGGATIKTNALYSVAKLGDRPPGGRVVLTCHEREQVPLTYHLHARLQGQACFVVTYCYTAQSPEYRAMILYRDEILSKTFFGRAFIKGYYLSSPHLVKWASYNRYIDAFVRKVTKIALPVFINRLNRKKNYPRVELHIQMTQVIYPFHLAIPVDDLSAARRFYGEILGCREGRTSDLWTDYDLYGHQLVIHYAPATSKVTHHNPVDGHDVPVPHFGVVLPWEEWERLAERMKKAGISFVIEPHIRFAGQVGEQATMFFMDPCGNALEFKAFKDIGLLFAK